MATPIPGRRPFPGAGGRGTAKAAVSERGPLEGVPVVPQRYRNPATGKLTAEVNAEAEPLRFEPFDGQRQLSRDRGQHGRGMMRRYAFCLGSLVSGLVLACMAGLSAAASSAESPPVGEPREKLTINGKEVFEGRRVLFDEDSYPRQAASLVEGPTVSRASGGATVRFALDRADDVLVRIVDAEGKTVRQLACGVLGENAPRPFEAGPLRQELVWDGKDEEGKPVAAPCSVRVSVGLRPRFDRFVGYDPGQMLNHVRGLEVDPEGRVYVSMIPGAMAEAEIVRFDREGRRLDTINPINPNLLPGKLEDLYPECNTVDGVTVPAYRGYRPIFWFYCTGGAFNPIRIADDGKIEIACIRQWFTRGPEPGPRIYTVEKTEPFWFRKPLWTQLIVWAIDREGFAYYRDVRARSRSSPSVVIRKVNIATSKPALDFAYYGTEVVREARLPRRGRPTRRQRCPDRLPQRLRFSS